jgi:hypothetical protein
MLDALGNEIISFDSAQQNAPRGTISSDEYAIKDPETGRVTNPVNGTVTIDPDVLRPWSKVEWRNKRASGILSREPEGFGDDAWWQNQREHLQYRPDDAGRGDLQFALAGRIALARQQISELEPEQLANLKEIYPFILGAGDGVTDPQGFRAQYEAGLKGGGTYTAATAGPTEVFREIQEGQAFSMEELLQGDQDPTLFLAMQSLYADDYEESVKGASWSKALGYTTAIGTELAIDFLAFRGIGTLAKGTKMGRLAFQSTFYRNLVKGSHYKKVSELTKVAGVSFGTKAVGSVLLDNYSIEQAGVHTALEVAGYMVLKPVGGLVGKYFKGKGAQKAFAALDERLTTLMKNGDLSKIKTDDMVIFMHTYQNMARLKKPSKGVQAWLAKSKGKYNTLMSALEMSVVDGPRAKPVINLFDDVAEEVVEKVTPSKRTLNVPNSTVGRAGRQALTDAMEPIEKQLKDSLPAETRKKISRESDEVLETIKTDEDLENLLKHTGQNMGKNPAKVEAARRALMPRLTEEAEKLKAILKAADLNLDDLDDVEVIEGKVLRWMTDYFKISGEASATLRAYTGVVQPDGSIVHPKGGGAVKDLKGVLEKALKATDVDGVTPTKLSKKELQKKARDLIKLIDRNQVKIGGGIDLKTGLKRNINTLVGVIRMGYLSVNFSKKPFELIATGTRYITQYTEDFIKNSLLMMHPTERVRASRS